MVDGEDAPTIVGQRVERGKPHRPIEARPAVERDERPACTFRVDVELDVADVDAHAGEPTAPASREKRQVRPEGLTAKKFTEPVALSSTQPADLPVARTALELSFDLSARRARCKGEPTVPRGTGQGHAQSEL